MSQVFDRLEDDPLYQKGKDAPHLLQRDAGAEFVQRHGAIFGGRRFVILFLCAAAALGVFALKPFLIDEMEQPKSKGSDSLGKAEISHRLFLEVAKSLGYAVVQNRSIGPASLAGPVLFLEPEADATFLNRAVLLEDIIEKREKEGYSSLLVIPKWKQVASNRHRRIRGRIPDSLENSKLGVFTKRKAPRLRRIHMDGKSFQVKVPALTAAYVPESLAVAVLELNGDEGPISILEGSGDEEKSDALFQNLEEALPVATKDEEAEGADDSTATEETMVWAVAWMRHPSTALRKTMVVSDADLFHSFAMQLADNADLVFSIIDEVAEGDTFAIDEVMHGHGIQLSIARALSTRPTKYLYTHFLVFLAFGFWYFMHQRLRRVQRKDQAISSSEISAKILANHAGERSVAIGYAKHAVSSVALYHGLAPTLDDATVAKLQALAERHGANISVSMLASFARDGSSLSSKDALLAANELIKTLVPARLRDTEIKT